MGSFDLSDVWSEGSPEGWPEASPDGKKPSAIAAMKCTMDRRTDHVADPSLPVAADLPPAPPPDPSVEQRTQQLLLVLILVLIWCIHQLRNEVRELRTVGVRHRYPF